MLRPGLASLLGWMDVAVAVRYKQGDGLTGMPEQSGIVQAPLAEVRASADQLGCRYRAHCRGPCRPEAGTEHFLLRNAFLKAG